jgi:protein TonB
MQVRDDRFAVSLLIALGLHAFVLLGLGFVLDFKPLKHPLETLDVVLVNWRSEKAPDKADFLAQAAQQGGGESKKAVPPVMKHAGVAPAAVQGEDARDQQEQPARAATAARQQVQVESRDAPSRPQETREAQPPPPLPTAATLRREGMAMARLEAGIRRDQDTSAKLPRRKWISANTREYEYAAYMRAWVAKVERVGNLNYPEEVRRKKLVGDLVMTVGINRDGSVESIDITRSSGMPELDQAARRIVRLAAPYSPLPDNIKKSVDVLHITRTWRFSRDFRGLN